MKRLLICRHAKSSWKDMTLSDEMRPLNKRGKRDTPEMGSRLRKMGIVLDALYTSPAKRAKKTAKILAGELQFSPENIEIVPLYEASPHQIISILQNTDPGLSTIMIVGHNPDFTLLANLLGHLNIYNIPTCGVVALDFEMDDWKEIANTNGQLVFFEYPKKGQQDSVVR